MGHSCMRAVYAIVRAGIAWPLRFLGLVFAGKRKRQRPTDYRFLYATSLEERSRDGPD